MKRTLWLVFGMVLAIMIAEGISLADCERCDDSHLACTGDSASKVKGKCGEPARVINYYNGFNALVEYEFVYDLGGGKFYRYFLFNASSDELISISLSSKQH